MKKLLFTQRRLAHHCSMAKVVGVVVLCFFIFSSLFSEAQNPLVKMWDKRFGGTYDDYLNAVNQTSDGEYILGGASWSEQNGDISDSSRGGGDYWIVKTDSSGNKEWDKRYGGTDVEHLYSIEQTKDKGYILGGYSLSGIGGDKTEPAWGNGDYWMVKTDSLGVKQWDKRFGGLGNDACYSLKQTSDNGFILGGWSNSGISGDRTVPDWGGGDYWIVKTDSLGNKQWDTHFGGTKEDRLASLEQTNDGGYILGGYSFSGVSGDRTQANWDTACIPVCSEDYWIVKTDSLGIKQWDKRYGTNDGDFLSCIHQTNDEGYILGGCTSSGINGDKTEPSRGYDDYWIVKTDSVGNLQWNKTFGGTLEEQLFSIIETSNKEYLISGTSDSDSSGDKSENNLGTGIQTWIIKTDSLHNKLWDKTIFTMGGGFDGNSIITRDACYVICNAQSGGIGGYKSEPNRDSTNESLDYWIIKFCDSTLTTNIPNTEKANEQLLLFPNPTTGKFTIQNSSLKIDRIEIYNLIGEKKYAAAVSSSSQQIIINIESFPAGIYFVKTIAGEKVLFGKVIKE